MTTTELRALLELATPGPWILAGTKDNPCPCVSSHHPHKGYQIHSMLHLRDAPHRPFMWDKWCADAALIAALRNHGDALRGIADAARALVDAADEEPGVVVTDPHLLSLSAALHALDEVAT